MKHILFLSERMNSNCSRCLIGGFLVECPHRTVIAVTWERSKIHKGVFRELDGEDEGGFQLGY